MFKSQFIEMFGKLDSNTKHYPIKKLSEIADYWNGLTYKPTDIVQDGTGILVSRSSNIQNGAVSFDDNVQVVNNKVTFYHSGRIAVGNRGSGKIDELRMFVEERYPKIIEGKRFHLGTLINDHLWNIDQPDVIEVIANCISYALIRDEYREYVKQIKK